MKTRTIKTPKSLRARLTLLVLACWILPVTVTVLAGRLYVASVTRERAETSVSREADFAVSQVMGHISRAIELSRNLSRYTDMLDVIREERGTPGLRQAVQNRLSLIYESRENILFACLYLWEDPDFLMYVEPSPGTGGRYEQAVHGDVAEAAYALGPQIGFHIADGEIYLIRNLFDDPDSGPPGTLVLRLDPQITLDGFYQMEWEPAILYNLSGQWGGVRAEAAPDEFLEGLSYGQTRQTRRGAVYYGKRREADFSFAVRIEVSLNTAFPERVLLAVLEIAQFLLILPMLVIVVIFFRRHVDRPLRGLLYAARRLEDGELGVLTDVDDSSAEFNYMTRGFNSMSTRLKELFDEVYREELAVRDAKILALRSQINPHFLNNTLELMNWQARMNGAEPVCDMIEALSILLDAALNRSGNREAPLREELACADAYILIISRRFGSRLKVTRDIDEALLGVMTPPLVIQPLMENAVAHGLDKLAEGELRLSVFREDGDMIIEVYNSGVLSASDEHKIQRLLSEEHLSGRLSPAHMGILNVQERLLLLYGSGSRLTIQSRGGGTAARIRIPIARADTP
ncbi:MAG: sensor histidine kinase [Oscillospiraceae bacterium]|nr:sensor histidine kinase [Oscillospiraceae bacterium]